MSFEPISSPTATSTSDVSRFVSGPVRPLTRAEADLLFKLIDMLPQAVELRRQMADALVQDAKDGSMGSLRFVNGNDDRKARKAVAARSLDADGISLEITLNLDQYGKLFELDVWKVDFSPLSRLPEPAHVRRV